MVNFGIRDVPDRRLPPPSGSSLRRHHLPHFLQLLLYRMISTQQEAGIVTSASIS